MATTARACALGRQDRTKSLNPPTPSSDSSRAAFTRLGVMTASLNRVALAPRLGIKAAVIAHDRHRTAVSRTGARTKASRSASAQDRDQRLCTTRYTTAQALFCCCVSVESAVDC